MNKNISLFIFFLCFLLNNTSAQLSVYVSPEDGIYGWSVDSTNKQFQRHKKAEADCIKNGGKNPRLQFEGDDNDMTGQNGQYGCYALIYGTDAQGKRHFGMSHMRETKEEAMEEAKWKLSKSVQPGSVVIVLNDCLEKGKKESSLEADAKKMAGYYCKGSKLQDQMDKDPNNEQFQKEFNENARLGKAFEAETERKYKSEKDSELFRKIFMSELEKICK